MTTAYQRDQRVTNYHQVTIHGRTLRVVQLRDEFCQALNAQGIFWETPAAFRGHLRVYDHHQYISALGGMAAIENDPTKSFDNRNEDYYIRASVVVHNQFATTQAAANQAAVNHNAPDHDDQRLVNWALIGEWTLYLMMKLRGAVWIVICWSSGLLVRMGIYATLPLKVQASQFLQDCANHRWMHDRYDTH